MKERIFKKDPQLKYIGRTIPEKSVSDATEENLTLVVFFARSGIKLAVDDKENTVHSGDIAIVDFNRSVSVELGELPENSVTYMLVSNVRLYGDIDLYGNDYKLGPTGDYRGIIESTLRQLMREEAVDLPAGESLKETLMSTVMTLLIRVMPVTLRPHKSANVYYSAKEYLDNNYLSDETLVEVCKKLNIDRFYLTHVFKQELGIPPVKYIIGKRMQQARELLETTELDINVVAKSCGYVDPAYFCRVFRQTQGCTALKYRADFKAKLYAERMLGRDSEPAV